MKNQDPFCPGYPVSPDSSILRDGQAPRSPLFSMHQVPVQISFYIPAEKERASELEGQDSCAAVSWLLTLLTARYRARRRMWGSTDGSVRLPSLQACRGTRLMQEVDAGISRW